ncbi:hypothetical protein Nepgr_030769 [Nepenthes gracilis]|uniref:Ribosomal protein L19 n=1 Tax=Nepenthes gracilis TaxID=150966 RepID=A0AAD3TH84_NEPGR|nr:hypothetical protein Nepgr_030769 [Nepenthes gracilis]
MDSRVLLHAQAMFEIPRNHLIQFPPTQKLTFSTDFARHFSIINYTRISFSGVSRNSYGLSFHPIISKPGKQSFVVRSEAISDGREPEVVENSGVIGDASDSEVAQESQIKSEKEEISEAEVEQKPPRKRRVKMGEIMGILNKRAVDVSDKERPIPDIRTGDIVEIKFEVPENRRRLSVYKGIVISKQNAGIHSTIRIRRIIAGVGVEIVFPLYSPNIKELKVVDHRKVRKARLYYLREKLPRLSTFK